MDTISDRVHDLLEQFYYGVVLAAASDDQAVAMLHRAVNDLTDARVTVALYGVDTLATAIAQTANNYQLGFDSFEEMGA